MKIAAMGDTHLGFRQYGYAQRETDFMDAFKRAFELARHQGVQAMIHTGDLYNVPRPAAHIVNQVRDCVRAFGSPVLGVDGNHDAAENEWLVNAGIQPLQAGPMQLGGYRIGGINSVRPSIVMETVKQYLHDHTGTMDIFVIHQLVDELTGFGQAVSLHELVPLLEPRGVRVILMGDLHKPEQLVVGNVLCAYTGSTEMNSTSEPPEKSIIVLDISKTDRALSRVPIATRTVRRQFLETEKQLDELVASAAVCDIANSPILLIEYDISAGSDLARRARNLLEGKCMFRVEPLTHSQAANVAANINSSGFKRSDAIAKLREVIAARFAPNTDEYQLITSCIDGGVDQVETLILAYAKSKGII